MSSLCSTGAAGWHPGLFLRASTTSRINAFLGSSSSMRRRNASASSLPSPAFRLRRGVGLLVWLAFLFLGRSAAMPPSRYAMTQLWTAPVRGLGLLLLGLASTAGQLIGSMLIDWLVPALGTQVYLVTVLGAFVALAGAVIAAIPSAKNESDAAASQSIA